MSAGTSVVTVDLGYEQMLLVEERRPRRLKVVYGGVWLTEAGRAQDWFLRDGDEVQLHAREAALIEALAPTRVEIAPESTRATMPGWWDRMTSRLAGLRDALRAPERTAASC